MSKDAQIEVHVWYSTFKKMLTFFNSNRHNGWVKDIT